VLIDGSRRHDAGHGSRRSLRIACLPRWAFTAPLRLSASPPRSVDGTCEAAHHAAEPAAGHQVQLFRQGRGDAANISTLSDRATSPQSNGVRDATILIWPESAFPFFLSREADAMAQIAELLPQAAPS
jgi:hypothetical protein